MKKTKAQRLCLVYKLVSIAQEVFSMEQIFSVFERSFKRVETIYAGPENMQFHPLRHYVAIKDINISFCEHSGSVVVLSDSGEIVIFQTGRINNSLYKEVSLQHCVDTVQAIYEHFLKKQKIFFCKTKPDSYLTSLIQQNKTYKIPMK